MHFERCGGDKKEGRKEILKKAGRDEGRKERLEGKKRAKREKNKHIYQ